MPQRSTNWLNAKAGWSRNTVSAAIRSADFTSTMICSLSTISFASLSPSVVSRPVLRVSSLSVISACDGIGTFDLVLQLNDAVEQRLGSRRASGHVNIHRYDAVAAAHHRIGVVIVAAAIGTGTHGNDPARVGHLIVNFAQGGRHLVAQSAGNDHHI